MSKQFLWRPYDPENIRDPYQMYQQLRAAGPVHLAQTKEYIITRYDDVKNILKNNTFKSGNRLEWLKRGIRYFDNKEESFNAISQAMNSFILMLNAPQHMRIRNFVSKAWDNRQVDHIIRKNVAQLINGLPHKKFDVVADFAQPLPVLTICDILGIATDEYEYLKDLGIAMTKSLDLYVTLKDLVSMNDASGKFIAFFQEQIRLKSDKPDDGLLSKLIQKNKNENFGLTEEELISISIFLFIAGEETSASLISTGIYTLLNHPEQLYILRQNSALIESAVDEILRFDPVVHLLGRIASEETAIADKTIPANATVTLVIASANRDEQTFENPDQFLIDRNPNRHLSFGTGSHFCLGDWLAKKQGQIAIQALIDQYPSLKLAPQEIRWYNNLAIRTLKSLVIEV